MSSPATKPEAANWTSTATLCGVLFLSGASALIFESLWFREASLTFGNSVWATALVLCSFMGGLALGNGLAGRLGARLKSTIRAYAALELCIGVTGLALVVVLPLLSSTLAPLFRPLLERPALLNPLRLGVSFVLMLAPATAMGATLPLVVRALTGAGQGFGVALSLLYGWNTLGAVVGAVAVEWWLVGSLGVRGAGAVAASLNLCAGAAVLFTRLPPTQPQAAAAPLPRSVRRWRLLVAAFLCGATLLALEVVWFRFLLLFVRGSSRALAVLLAVILLGIGVGGLVGSAWLRRKSAPQWLSVLALGAGVLVVGSYLAFGLVLDPSLDGTLNTVALGLTLMFPVAVASGVLFTLVADAVRGEVDGDARAAGLVTTANTLGSTLGSLVGGFVLLPNLGVEGALFLAALLYGVVAAFTWNIVPADSPKPSRVLALTGLVFATCLAGFPLGQLESRFLPLAIQRSANAGARLVAWREGLTETVAYLEVDWRGHTVFDRLVTNGFSMSGSDAFARRYMKAFVYLPVALHPEPKRALLISYGVGNTAKALTDTRALEHIDVVDISRDVLELSSVVYPDPSTHPLNDPRVKVWVEDGRYFLQATQERYDLITAEPPPPKIAGVVNLYTREYFELLKSRLSEGGIVSYWLPVHDLLPNDTSSIVGAFCGAFEDCTLWGLSGFDWMLVGSRGARPVSAAQFSRQWSDEVASRELKALGFETPASLGATYLGDAKDLRIMAASNEPLVDNFPKRLAEGMGPLDRKREAFYFRIMDPAPAAQRFEKSEWIQRLWPAELRAATVAAFPLQWIINRRIVHGSNEINFAELHQTLTTSDSVTVPLWLMLANDDVLRIAEAAAANHESDPELSALLGVGRLAHREYRAAAQLLETAPQPDSDPTYVHLRAYALCLSGDAAAAGELRQQWLAKPRSAADSAFWVWLGKTFSLDSP